MDSKINENQFANFRCPKCGSDNTSSFSAIHEGGTSHIQTRSMLTGVAVSGGNLTPILGGSSTSGVQQSVLAQKTTPPTLRSVYGVGCFVLTIVFIVPVLASILGIGGYFVIAAYADASLADWKWLTQSLDSRRVS